MRPRRQRTEDGRRLASAGSAVLVTWLGLVLASLLNAPGMHKTAFNQDEGVARDVALAITGPLAGLSSALQLDSPRELVKSVLGRSDDDVIDTEIALPEPTTTAPPAPAEKLHVHAEAEAASLGGGRLARRRTGVRDRRGRGREPGARSRRHRRRRIATGLERPDVFDWFDHVRREVRRLRPKAVILGLGGNDDHGYMTGVPEGVTLDGFGGPAWTNEYRRRVGGLMDTAARGGAYVVWIGLPITRTRTSRGGTTRSTPSSSRKRASDLGARRSSTRTRASPGRTGATPSTWPTRRAASCACVGATASTSSVPGARSSRGRCSAASTRPST